MQKTFKKVVSLILAAVLVFSLSACAKGADQSTPSQTVSSNPNFTSEQVTVSDEARPFYKPTSLTLTLYDAVNNVYGFNWNTEFKPLEPVVQICEGTEFLAENCTEYQAEVNAESVYTPTVTIIYIAKANMKLKENTTYTYRAYDKGAEIGTQPATFTTANHTAESFSFVHVSDSQVNGKESDVGYTGEETGIQFGKTLNEILKIKPSFMLHTGDIVEWSKYETYWKNMLDYNASALMTLPFMPISGNHETTYRSGDNEIFKHFNINIPDQNTNKGFFYFFDIGDVRFIMLNTNNLNDMGLDSPQCVWLEDALNTNKKWKIVAMHHPMYSVGKWGSDPEQNATSLKLRKQLSKLFAENGVDLVLQGHDHTYSKTYPINAQGKAVLNSAYRTENSVKYTVNPGGTIYAMHGAAGNQNRSPVNVDEGLFEFSGASKPSSFAEIKVEKDRITVYVNYADNNKTVTYASYGIIKE
ncbi:MAG: metallophosphoesterase family protein [Clostridia bacterium]|nr:metallophosphoesterase family protein [Clostridia bacterium]